ncbi:MAG: InlB B-repeat-containing protein, partial [Defluviitaleaceae bacterium]|nr:InlB B-repeat-containing protein [Defluviitaleaceae bacterium]
MKNMYTKQTTILHRVIAAFLVVVMAISSSAISGNAVFANEAGDDAYLVADYGYEYDYDYEYEVDYDELGEEGQLVYAPAFDGMIVPASSGEAAIVIDLFTSSNRVFTTNNSNMLPLSLQVRYAIHGTGDASGNQIRIALEDDATTRPTTFFATTMSGISVELTSAGEQHIDQAGIFVESIGGQNTLVIPFIGGENNVTLDTIIINIEFNREWDGTIAPGHELHIFEAWAVNEGEDSTALAVNVESNTTDPRVWTVNGGGVNVDIPVGDGIFGNVNSRTLVFTNTNPRFWEFEEGTQLTLTLPIPENAEVGNATTNTISGSARPAQMIGDDLVWEIPVEDILAATTISFLPRISFPSAHFSAGEVIQIDATISYFLQDAVTGSPVPINRTITVNITLTGGGVPNGEIILSWNPGATNLLASTNAPRDVATDNLTVNNQNNLPLENVVITLYNNPGVDGAETGTKAQYGSRHDWFVGNRGVRVESEWTFFIRDVYGASREAQVMHPGSAGVSPGDRVGFRPHVAAGLAPNEYIDKIEIRPQYNGRNALAPGAAFLVQTRFAGFSAQGTDHTGGFVGQNADGFVDILQRVTITHDGIVEPFEHDFTPRFFPVVDFEAVDAAVDAITARHGGTAIAPGGALPIEFMARASNNTSNTHFRTIGTTWDQPSFLMFVPQNASIDTTQTVEVVRHQQGQSLGNMTIDFLGIESTGQRVYRLQMQPGVSISQTSSSAGNDVLRFVVNVNTPIGTPAGNTNMRVWMAAYSGAGAQHTLYQARRMDAGGLTTTSNAFYDDVNNWTGHNDIAPYLRIRTASLTYTVATSAGMLARANTWSHTSNAWELGGISTVPVGGEGRFQLEVVNTGNQFVGGVRLYNVLPNSGTTNTASGAGSVASQWDASLESLTFRVYDVAGVDITSTFTGSQIWVSEQYNSNPDTNHPIVMGAIGNTFAVANATNMETARSFFFDLGTARRLPPGARIVIEGAVALPDTMDAADIGQTAQNSFVASGQFFNAATGGAGVNTPVLSDVQTFEATAENNASIAGVVNRALATGVADGPLAGVAVRLYSGGTAAINFTGQETTTAADGTFSFAGLAAGNYYLRFMNPFTATTGMTEVFEGTSLAADGRNAVTSTITLNAEAAGHGFTVADVSLVRTGRVLVEFRRAGDNSLVGSIHTEHANVNLDTSATGTVTPGEIGQVAIPANYTIQGAAYQDFALTWDEPSQTLVFQVTRDQFTVLYSNNGGSGTISSQTEDTNVNITLSDGAGFTRNGHTIAGWATEPTGAVVYALGATFTRGAAGNVTLYAVWTPNPHTVTYLGNSNTGGTVPGVVDTYFGADVTLAGEGDLVRTGHTFAGWRENATTLHAAGDIITIAGNVTLTAEWTPINFNVTYDANWATGDLGTISGAVPAANNPYNYGDTVAVLANPNTLARTGHTLLGWSRDAAATTAEFSLSGSFTMPASDVTLYAIWQVQQFNVTFRNNHNATDNTNHVPPVSVDYGSSLDVLMPAVPYFTGHAFLGWFSNRAGTGDEFTPATVVNGDITVYASWQANPHTVTYQSSGHTGGAVPAVVNTTFGATVTVAGQGTLLRNEYRFVGWIDADDNIFVEGNTITISGDVVLTAVWEALDRF